MRCDRADTAFDLRDMNCNGVARRSTVQDLEKGELGGRVGARRELERAVEEVWVNRVGREQAADIPEQRDVAARGPPEERPDSLQPLQGLLREVQPLEGVPVQVRLLTQVSPLGCLPALTPGPWFQGSTSAVLSFT